MIWILATRGAATKLRTSPYTETLIRGVHSVVYRPGIEPVRSDGSDASAGPPGEYMRGAHRVAGLVYVHHGSAAEELLSIAEEIDLILRYRASGSHRVRRLARAVFLGDATVAFPNLNTGRPGLISVPFRLQIPSGYTLADAISDEEE